MSNGGLDKVRLGRLHAVMSGYVERGEMPGLVGLVSRRGEVHVEAIGKQSFAEPAPMRRDSLFRIASMTKPIAAVAALILVEECKLRLDEPVDKWLPELGNRRVLKRIDSPIDDTVPAKRALTLRDLLTFRLGMGMVMAKPDTYPIQKALRERGIRQGPPQPQKDLPPDEWMQKLGSLPLLYQPGEVWMYDTGSDVISVLIARASGQSFEAFLRERIFAPLGMKDTTFAVPADQLHRLTTSYATDRESGQLVVYDPAEGGQWSRPAAFQSGAGGLVSTIDDYWSFGQMMLNHGHLGNVRILSRPSIAVMTTDQLTPEQKATANFPPGFFDSYGWGFGVSIVTHRDDLTKSVGKYGWDGGLGTSWTSDPREEMITIILTQQAWSSPKLPAVCRDFATLAYQSIND